MHLFLSVLHYACDMLQVPALISPKRWAVTWICKPNEPFLSLTCLLSQQQNYNRHVLLAPHSLPGRLSFPTILCFLTMKRESYRSYLYSARIC